MPSSLSAGPRFPFIRFGRQATVQDGADLAVADGGTITVEEGATVTVASGLILTPSALPDPEDAVPGQLHVEADGTVNILVVDAWVVVGSQS